MSEQQKSKIALILAYNGSSFSGWQAQPSLQTIQATLEQALLETCSQKVHVYGSGRTDSGVHAWGQVAHFVVPENRLGMTVENWVHALNSRLPATVRVLAAHVVADSFHAQFDVKVKTYCYRLWLKKPLDPLLLGQVWSPLGKLDLTLMQQAAQLLVGVHDFSAFAALRGDGSDPQRGEGSTRELFAVDLGEFGMEWRIFFAGNGFLYRMVRMLVGAIVEVGRARLSLQEFAALLDQDVSLPLVRSPLCAPAEGLCLYRVAYASLGEDPVLPHPWDN